MGIVSDVTTGGLSNMVISAFKMFDTKTISLF